MPLAVSNAGQEKDQPLSLQPCFRPGFTEPVPHDTAGALLPHLCTLTCEPLSVRKAPSAVFFCGTILTIARTGRYPASLVFRKPGLSSDLSLRQIRNHLAYSFLTPVYRTASTLAIWGREAKFGTIGGARVMDF